jgi:uncharacterized protein involved in exopolysaccharide biosynthesis
VTETRDAAVPQGEDTLSLLALWHIARAEWRIIACIIGLFTVASVIVALVMTPIYRAEAIVSPVDTNRRDLSGSSLVGQLSGLAGLAGINLSGLTGGPNKGRIMIQSRSLLEEFIKRNNLIPVLFEQGDESDEPPTLWLAVERFKELYSAEEDPETGLITVRVEWMDPQLAAKWANDLVNLANELLRQRDLADAERNIKYLNKQLSDTNVLGLQEVLYNLIEIEMRTLMLANARAEYALSVVDEAVVPELRYSPKRKQLVVLGGLLGCIVAAFVVALRRTLRKERELLSR